MRKASLCRRVSELEQSYYKDIHIREMSVLQISVQVVYCISEEWPFLSNVSKNQRTQANLLVLHNHGRQ